MTTDEQLVVKELIQKLEKRLEIYGVYAKSAYKRLKWGDFNRYVGRCDEIKEIMEEVKKLIADSM